MANIDVYVGNTRIENWKHANCSLSWDSVRVASLEREKYTLSTTRLVYLGFRLISAEIHKLYAIYTVVKCKEKQLIIYKTLMSIHPRKSPPIFHKSKLKWVLVPALLIEPSLSCVCSGNFISNTPDF